MKNKEQFQELALRIGFDIYEENGEFLYAETKMAYELFQAIKSNAAPEGFVLDAPARIGGVVFREGVRWKTLIESAQRLYEQSKNEIKPIVSPADMLKIASGELVLVPASKVKYFSNDGENYEVHNTLEEARRVAESAIEFFSEQLADQQLDPECDGNFHQVGYGIVLAESGYSIDHVVTQEDIDRGDYSYDVGTQIMSLFLVEAQEQIND